MLIVENMDDKEVKMKKTRRGKRSGRRNRRGDLESFHMGDDEMSALGLSSHANKDLKSVKWRKFYVRPRYSPTAPHNSTQFIMADQHRCLSYSDNLAELSRTDEMSLYPCNHGDLSKCSDYEVQCSDYGSPSSDLDSLEFKNLEIDSSLFMANDFESFYNQLRADELSKRSKDELVEEILCMEDKVSNLEGRVSSLQGRKTVSIQKGQIVPKTSTTVSSDKKIKVKSRNMLSSLQDELELLKRENRKLKQEKLSISSR